MFESNSALVIVPDLGRPVFGGTLEGAPGFLVEGVVLGWGVTALPLTSAVGGVGRAAGFAIGRETDAARES